MARRFRDNTTHPRMPCHRAPAPTADPDRNMLPFSAIAVGVELPPRIVTVTQVVPAW